MAEAATPGTASGRLVALAATAIALLDRAPSWIYQIFFRIGLAFDSARGGSRAVWGLDVEVDADGAFAAVRDMRVIAAGPAALRPSTRKGITIHNGSRESLRMRRCANPINPRMAIIVAYGSSVNTKNKR